MLRSPFLTWPSRNSRIDIFINCTYSKTQTAQLISPKRRHPLRYEPRLILCKGQTHSHNSCSLAPQLHSPALPSLFLFVVEQLPSHITGLAIDTTARFTQPTLPATAYCTAHALRHRFTHILLYNRAPLSIRLNARDKSSRCRFASSCVLHCTPTAPPTHRDRL